MKFEWDERKARTNLAKHGVSFETASKVFDDPGLRERHDDSSNDESRFRVVGRIGTQVYFVVYTEREGALRIITARRASRHEEKAYYAQTF